MPSDAPAYIYVNYDPDTHTLSYTDNPQATANLQDTLSQLAPLLTNWTNSQFATSIPDQPATKAATMPTQPPTKTMSQADMRKDFDKWLSSDAIGLQPRWNDANNRYTQAEVQLAWLAYKKAHDTQQQPSNVLPLVRLNVVKSLQEVDGLLEISRSVLVGLPGELGSYVGVLDSRYNAATESYDITLSNGSIYYASRSLLQRRIDDGDVYCVQKVDWRTLSQTELDYATKWYAQASADALSGS